MDKSQELLLYFLTISDIIEPITKLNKKQHVSN